MRVLEARWPGSDLSAPDADGIACRAHGSEERLILALARRQYEPELARLAAAADYVLLESTLRRLKLLGLLGSRLVDAFPHAVPAAFVASVADIVSAGRRDAAHMELITWRLLQVLANAGITAMPLKGPLLAERLHGDPGLRLSHDVDLLVTPDELRPAVAALEGVGCTRPRMGDALPRLHHIFETPGGRPIELHWRIHWYESTYAKAMLRRSCRRNGVLVPSPADELLSLLLFHARDGMTGLRTPVDVAAWWTQNDPEGTAGPVGEIVARHPRLALPAAAAALAVERVLGLPVPGVVSPRPRARRRVRAAARLSDWSLARSPAESDAATKIIDGLVTDASGLPGFLVRAGLPRLPGPRATLPLRQLLYNLALVRHALPLLLQLWRDQGLAPQTLSPPSDGLPATPRSPTRLYD